MRNNLLKIKFLFFTICCSTLSFAQLSSGVLVSDVGTSNNIGQSSTSRNVSVNTSGVIGVVFVGSSGVRFAKSTNRGVSFSASVQLTSTTTGECEVNMANNGTIYVAHNSVLYISTNGGSSFTTNTVGFGPTPHIASYGSNVYIINSGSSTVYRNNSNGSGTFLTSTATGGSAYSDIFADQTNGDVYVGSDNPTLFLNKSTNSGVSFSSLSPTGSIYYSSYTLSAGSLGSFIFSSGGSFSPTNAAKKINCTNGVTTSLTFSNNSGTTTRTLAADDLGDVIDGYPSGSDVEFKVSQNLGSSFASAITITNASLHNIAINTNTQDVVVAYTGTNGQVYLNVYDGLLLPRITPPGNSISFDGTNDYTEHGVSINNALTGTNTITVEAWVNLRNLTSSNGFQTVLGNYDGGNKMQFMLRFDNSGLPVFWISNGTTNAGYSSVSGTTNFTTNQWVHLACTWDGTTMKIYRNGILENSILKSGNFPSDNQPFRIGTSKPAEIFGGKIDEVRIWNTARTLSELQANMYNTISGTSTGLLAYYNFDNGIADGTNTGLNTLTDLTTNANNGILNNFDLTGSNSNWVESYAMVVPTPIAATSITGSSFTANWTAPVIGTVDNGYRLDVSTSSTFASAISGSPFTVLGTTKVLTGLASGTNHYYRVRADKLSVTGTGGHHYNYGSATTLNPTVITSGTLSAFTACIGLVSTAQSFSVSGSNLTTDIVVTPPTGYEVSTISGVGFASTVTLTQSGGTVSSTTIYVRLTNAAIGTLLGNIACTSLGATTKNVAVSGTVTLLPIINSATKLTYNGADLTCFGQSDGLITIVATGGTGALQYSNGGAYQVSNMFAGLAPNPYTLIVKDANACLSTSSVVTINQPDALSGTVSNNGPICANTTLSLSGTILGGTGSLSYSWSGANTYTSAALASTVSINATVAMSGLYTVTVTDANNCTYNPTTNVVVNPIPTASIIGTNSVCKDAPSPLLTFTGANGTAPYTFTYNINGGSDLTVSTASALNNSVNLPAPTHVAGTFTYNLLNVVDASSTHCSSIATGSEIITIRPKPILSSNALPVLNTICEGTSTTITCTNATESFSSPAYTNTYTNNFNSTIGSEWTFPIAVPANIPTIKSYNGNNVLGYLSNQQVIFNKSGIPNHDFVTIEFDLFIHDTWDGNSVVSGPDMWSMTVDGVNKINTTFSNETWNSTTQSYPNDFSASNASFTSSITHVLPTACNLGGGSLSSQYHIIKTIPHTSASLNVILEAMGLENICNESWSIDNFDVQYRSQTSASNIVWTDPAVTSTSILVSPIVNTYFVATLGTCSDTINIIVNPTPRADFNINTVNQCVTSNSYHFTNASTLASGGAMTYAWTMTGAATTSATLTDIVGNSYANYGDFNAMVVATSVIGNCSDSRGIKTKTVSISPPVLITATLPNPICIGTTLQLTANQVLGNANAVAYNASYNNNFESSIGSAWTFPANVTNNVPALLSYNGSKILGYLTNQQAVYSQTGLASHDYIKIDFDLYLHDSWDGNSTDSIGGSLIGKDIWKMDLNGASIINTNFSNFSFRTQSYPGNIAAINQNGTNAVSNNLPTVCNHNGGALSSVYHISKIVPHTASAINLVLEAMGLEEICNESWSIDNMDIQIGSNTATPTLLSACNGLGSGLVNYTLSHSNDFNTAIGSAWSFPDLVPANVPALKSYNSSSVLGYLGSQQAAYNQTGLSAHNYVKVEFDLYIHDTWDGNDNTNGPDIWSMSVNGNNVLNTTFSNFSYRSQAYPNNVTANNANGTAALSNTLPTVCNHNGGALSSKYHISKIVPHSASSLNIVLEALGLENVCNESWSIDNFEVYLGVAAGVTSPAIWSNSAVTCNIDITPVTNTNYTTSIGACTSATYAVNVSQIPIPSFIFSNGSCSKSIIFTNTNIEIGATYVWNFGDGSADYTGNTAPAHLYANGNYTVTLTASFSAGCNAVTTQTINIVDAPVAAIAFVGGVGCGNTIQFSSISTIPVGTSPIYLWSFGETIPTTSNLQNPLKTYSMDGNYTVSLTVTTGLGCSSTATTAVTSAAVIGSYQALFSAVISGNCGNFVTTVNSSTGTGNIYAWNFGDGNFSNEVAPTHFYNEGGDKTITLSITNAIGCASSAYQVVNISNNSGSNGRVAVDFSISPSISQVLLTNDFSYIPTFTNSSTNNPVLYCAGAPSWTYGDGTGSNYTNIYSKMYAAAGTYTVKIVQLTTHTGCYGEASKTVTVIPNPPFINSHNSNIETIQTIYESVSNSTNVLNVNKNNAEINMYPNPNKGAFKVKVNNISAANGDLIIVDMIGREIYKSNFAVKSNNDIIEVNGLNISPGTYHLVLNTNGATIARIPFVIITE